MSWIKTLVSLLCINNFFHSHEHTFHICKQDKIIPCVKFWRSRPWGGQGCFWLKLSLKNSFSPIQVPYTVNSTQEGGHWLRWHSSRLMKASPSSLEVIACKSVPEGAAHGGFMRKSIYKCSRTGKCKNLTAPAFGIEQKFLASNNLCNFTIS